MDKDMRMSREIQLSIGILVFGLLGIAGYWYMPQNPSMPKNQTYSAQVEEQIILPQYEKSIYQNIPQVQQYMSDVTEMIKSGHAVLPLQSNELDSDAQKVQELLLKNRDFLKDTVSDGKYLHNDMMRILPAIISSLDAASGTICQSHNCYQAEKYNFVTNATTRAIVDVEEMQVLSVERYPGMQPDISLRLTHIAQAIALQAPEVKKALGFTPRKKDITMANVRGTMKESPCDNTEHLCVAPTFTDHQKEQALWAVVDLTEMRLAAAKWAGLGKTTTPACISERSLQNRYIMKNYCQKDSYLEKDGWKITYRLTGSDGLEIRDVSFRGNPVLASAKIVDWHVSYQQKGGEDLNTSEEVYIEGRRVEFMRGDNGNFLFGYNDAMGCPLFSTSVVLAFNGPQIRELKNGDGFMLTQDFRNPKWPMACNYRYENRFEFYRDGSFRVVGVNKGRGCGDNALYRPVMRIDMALGGKENFYSYDDRWRVWEKEGSEHVDQRLPSSTNRYPYKLTSATDEQYGYYIEPNYGQFGDDSRGDNATLFVTKFKENEGDKDLLTLGSCCDLLDDGVERYLKEAEPIKESNIVLWYVPRIRNDAREGHEYCWADTTIGEDGNLDIQVWPCVVGPKFIPTKREN
jgi:hypothetical protein